MAFDDVFSRLFSRPAPIAVTRERALPGRTAPVLPVPGRHAALGTPIDGPFPAGTQVIGLALGCFWGAERALWELPGVFTTAVGYQGGFTPNPTYEEVCSGLTGHAETVRVAYGPDLATRDLLARFWELHDPTQGFRQGNDVGTQYRSAIYWTDEAQRDLAIETRDVFAPRLAAAGFPPITTEIVSAAQAGPFYLAEDYHQQYLVKNPNGYCPVHSTGVSCS
ncbi:peptide-methionine (S)-S-oxide reductase MsrA [Rarobacter incanus]|uniref:Peptide methionine sulfoxide reductase MsrA n=1 Tax=Rarobacter incanus TaxID=153494 RepID=A0A542SNS4_9MICO|nr:peptide-methionine (S)-S-oxide reductase MsrA [Rarobacter incanus]TQK76281.1 peptide-methionine (S)-S-oxide reductase [Rarobacter incanus]